MEIAFMLNDRPAPPEPAPADLPFLHSSRRRSLGWWPLRQPGFRLFRALFWQTLPRALRRGLLGLMSRSKSAPLAIDAPAAEPICVVGLLSSRSGIGEAGRLTGHALATLGYDVRWVDITDMPMTAPQWPPLEPGSGTIILHFNPDNLCALLTMLGRSELRGKRIIGYWAWELPRLPDHWLPALADVDEVWVPSRFVADAVRPHTEKPVRIVPHPVASRRAGTPRRLRFGIGGDFVALVMFNATSFPRKNVMAAVEAFRLAFEGADGRRLVVKVTDAEYGPEEMRELRGAIGDARNICVDARDMDDRERLDFIASADALISLHHSEGFGLVLAEAMLARVPVIATAWSGNLDFMDEDSALLVPFRLTPAIDPRGFYGADQDWAEPDVAVAARYLRALADAPSRFAPMRERAHAKAHDLLGLAAFGRSMAETFPADPRRRRLESPIRTAGAGRRSAS